MYCVAVIDWFSRFVLSWGISNTQNTEFCLHVLEQALARKTPEVFNMDQGAQFTSEKFTGRLLEADIRVSMDGRDRALDNVFVERLWRSLKYENVYLHNYSDPSALHKGIDEYFDFYNHQRYHESLEYRTPADVYYSTVS